MTSTERLQELAKLRGEFMSSDTTRDRRVEIVTKVVEFSTEELPQRCPRCKNGLAYIPWEEALAPGHVYSDAGYREATSGTGLCEFCFDEPFKGDEGYQNHPAGRDRSPVLRPEDLL